MSDEELMEFAALAGLDALDAAELADIETELSRATPEVRAAYAAELRATRELMATVSAAIEKAGLLKGLFMVRLLDGRGRPAP